METYDPKRRTLLRGTLAAGVTLVLLGCNSRDEDTASTPNTNPSSLGTDTAKADTSSSNKMTQEQARYQDSPRDGQKCENCANFFADSGTCRVVEGQVSPQGWCIVWASS
jgi:hypothetical protein